MSSLSLLPRGVHRPTRVGRLMRRLRADFGYAEQFLSWAWAGELVDQSSPLRRAHRSSVRRRRKRRTSVLWAVSSAERDINAPRRRLALFRSAARSVMDQQQARIGGRFLQLGFSLIALGRVESHLHGPEGLREGGDLSPDTTARDRGREGLDELAAAPRISCHALRGMAPKRSMSEVSLIERRTPRVGRAAPVPLAAHPEASPRSPDPARYSTPSLAWLGCRRPTRLIATMLLCYSGANSDLTGGIGETHAAAGRSP